MNSRLKAVAAAVAAGLAASCASVPPPADAPSVLGLLHPVADWQLAHPSRHPETEWTQGAGYAGFMALSRLPGGEKYETAMRAMGRRNGWQPGPRTYFADDHCVCQTYLELYLARRDEAMLTPTRMLFDRIRAQPPPHPELIPGRRNSPDGYSWCDALFMGPPAWARLYAATGDSAYLDWLDREWWKASDFLYDPSEHLYFRDGTYFDRRETNGCKVFWSRGNGWVMAGLCRVLDYMPPDWPTRPRYEAQFKDMAARILSLQPDDGLWRASLLDPDRYPLGEASGSAFFCYAFAWGVRHGLLDRDPYRPAAEKAWRALAACVAPDGRLTHVQPIGADPRAFDPGATEIYGVGAFLLAGSELYRLRGGPARPIPAARPLPTR